MSGLVDSASRRRALTEFDANLLVEAAAGTGKTAILAGRVAMLMADGREPSSIAAITFTEFAAGELGIRIRQFVGDLLGGTTPEVLAEVLPDGLDERQRACLEAAAARIDRLTITTIHGFCQEIIRAYAVEANIDPGAVVMDAGQSNALFGTLFERWLAGRLTGPDDPRDPVAVLAKDDPLAVVETLRELADLRRAHLTARPPGPAAAERPDLDFTEAVREFGRWFARSPQEPGTAAILDQLGALASFYDASLKGDPSYADLLCLTRPPRQPLMLQGGLSWRVYGAKTGWRRLAPEAAATLEAEAAAHYAGCRDAFQRLLGRLGGLLVSGLSEALDGVLELFSDGKRAAAVQDFDDLQTTALALVRGHEPVRQALGMRYRHILVDEFQDTDPVQAEVIFHIAAAVRPADWREAGLRRGALFLVGDPKQAIYRFRGAHVAAYDAVRDAFGRTRQDRVIRLQANFRSAPGIIQHVNACFADVLRQTGQPGYVALEPTLEPRAGEVCVTRLSIAPGSRADAQRDEEAETVARACRRLIGDLSVRRRDGSFSPLRPGDIALLAPTKRDLWRYERALEAVGLSVASQAGEALMLRQETQDILSLLRAIADPFDTLAFGAFLRGPLVGMTEGALLDVTEALPSRSDGRPSEFNLLTPVEQVQDQVARRVLEALQTLRTQASVLTPMALLGVAMERLHIRAVLALRARDRDARALANLDALLEMARPYAVRGLPAFVADLQAAWEARQGRTEGRTDEREDAVSIVTMHSAKGLEWPVVIPINTSTQLRSPDRFVHRQSDDTLHWVVGGVLPPDLEVAQAEEAANAGRERERLWYVACTRARNLLVLPHLPHLEGRTWSKVVDLHQANLPEQPLSGGSRSARQRPPAPANGQSVEVFEAEARRLAEENPLVSWRRPSDHDIDRIQVAECVDPESDDVETSATVGAGRVRGILLHKLMEELITGELVAEFAAVHPRAQTLNAELCAFEGLDQSQFPDADECADTALRTLALPAIAEVREHLVAELPVYGVLDGTFVAGRIDAARVEGGCVQVVFDWKSDVAPTDAVREHHRNQLLDYLRIVGAFRGAVVYMTRDEVIWVERASVLKHSVAPPN